MLLQCDTAMSIHIWGKVICMRAIIRLNHLNVIRQYHTGAQ